MLCYIQLLVVNTALSKVLSYIVLIYIFGRKTVL